MHGIWDILKILHKWFSATFCLFDLKFLRSIQVGTCISRPFIHLSLLCVTPLHEHSTSKPSLSCWRMLSDFHLLGITHGALLSTAVNVCICVAARELSKCITRRSAARPWGPACPQLYHTGSNWCPRGLSQFILLWAWHRSGRYITPKPTPDTAGHLHLANLMDVQCSSQRTESVFPSLCFQRSRLSV